MSVKVTLQLASAEPSVPSAEQLLRWAQAALGPALGPTAITIRVADEAEIQALNKGWRQIDGPTNALSFPLSGGAGAPCRPGGGCGGLRPRHQTGGRRPGQNLVGALGPCHYSWRFAPDGL